MFLKIYLVKFIVISWWLLVTHCPSGQCPFFASLEANVPTWKGASTVVFKKLNCRYPIYLFCHVRLRVCVCVCVCVCVRVYVSPDLTLQRHGLSCQAPLSMELSRQESWSGLPFLLQGIFSTQGSNPHLVHWQVHSLPLRHLGSPLS